MLWFRTWSHSHMNDLRRLMAPLCHVESLRSNSVSKRTASSAPPIRQPVFSSTTDTIPSTHPFSVESLPRRVTNLRFCVQNSRKRFSCPPEDRDRPSASSMLPSARTKAEQTTLAPELSRPPTLDPACEAIETTCRKLGCRYVPFHLLISPPSEPRFICASLPDSLQKGTAQRPRGPGCTAAAPSAQLLCSLANPLAPRCESASAYRFTT